MDDQVNRIEGNAAAPRHFRNYDLIMAAFVATMQMVLSSGVAARQPAEFLIVARVGGRPGPRFRSNATRLR